MPDTGHQRLLITGAAGFVGRRLIEALATRQPSWRVVEPRETSSEAYCLDVTDAAQVEQVVSEIRPTIIVNLAGVSAVTAAVRDPRRAWDVNLGGLLNIVEAARAHSPDAWILHVSTAEVYGLSFDSGEPINERALLQPTNAYAASKAAGDILARQSAESGLKTLIARPFNHIGPGQSNAFVVPAFARQIAEIEAGRRPAVMEVGSLDDERDFLDVDDVVDAYMLILENRERLKPGSVFNVASGKSLRIGDLLQRMLEMTQTTIEVEVDAKRLRAGGPTAYAGDSSKLRREVGWTPRINVFDTLERVLQFERANLLKGA